MQFTSLGSGSKGNATLIRVQDTLLMVDCGFGLKEAEARLNAKGVAPEQLTAILVTHEHGDHLRGAPMLAKRYNIPLFTTHGTARAFKQPLDQFRPVNVHQTFQLGCIEVEPVTVPHDAREPSQFVFHAAGLKLGVLTDLGSITPWVTRAYHGCDAVLLECNHDVSMLANGPYPSSLKRRVGGDWGHLSNDQAAALLQSIYTDRLQHLLVSHISDQNNDPELALLALESVLTPVRKTAITVLSQDDGCAWLKVTPAARSAAVPDAIDTYCPV